MPFSSSEFTEIRRNITKIESYIMVVSEGPQLELLHCLHGSVPSSSPPPSGQQNSRCRIGHRLSE